MQERTADRNIDNQGQPENREASLPPMPNEALMKRTVTMTSAIRLIQHLRSLSNDLPAQTAHVLFVIAQHPGITVQQLMKRTKLSQASCSRNITRLSEINRHGKPGFGLIVARRDPNEPRRHVMHLTPKGQQFMAVIEDILR